MGLISKVK